MYDIAHIIKQKNKYIMLIRIQIWTTNFDVKEINDIVI